MNDTLTVRNIEHHIPIAPGVYWSASWTATFMKGDGMDEVLLIPWTPKAGVVVVPVGGWEDRLLGSR